MPSKSHKLTARANRLATAKGPSLHLPPGPFAAEVDRILVAGLSAYGIPEIVIEKIRYFAGPAYVWADGLYFDCSLCGIRLPLVHTSLEEHCRSGGHTTQLKLKATRENASTKTEGIRS